MIMECATAAIIRRARIISVKGGYAQQYAAAHPLAPAAAHYYVSCPLFLCGNMRRWRGLTFRFPHRRRRRAASPDIRRRRTTAKGRAASPAYRISAAPSSQTPRGASSPAASRCDVRAQSARGALPGRLYRSGRRPPGGSPGCRPWMLVPLTTAYRKNMNVRRRAPCSNTRNPCLCPNETPRHAAGRHAGPGNFRHVIAVRVADASLPRAAAPDVDAPWAEATAPFV